MTKKAKESKKARMSSLKEAIRAAVAARGLQPVAAELGVGRSGLASYLTGTARAGTAFMVEARAALIFGADVQCLVKRAGGVTR